MNKIHEVDRINGLDVLRSVAIILVFMSHYTLLTGQSIFGPLGQMGGVGVDLFFALSGYLIGHQIFSAFIKHKNFSIKNFYARRFLRTFPNYFFILGLYFLFPLVREKPLTIPLWKFATFTQNFGLIPGAFSHAWSLCIEEQFYLVLPVVAFLLFRKGSLRITWLIVFSILVGEILLRGIIWLIYLRHAGDNIGQIYMGTIYAPTFSRLDSLVLGVSLALLKNYYNELWIQITKKGNLWLILGIIGYCVVVYVFQTGSPRDFFSVALNYSLLALSSTTLTLSALCQNSLLYKIRIPGAIILATWSYAIYLTHKSLIHLTLVILAKFHLNSLNSIMLTLSIAASLAGGWLLYVCIEKPFLKLRDKMGKVSSVSEANNKSTDIISGTGTQIAANN